MMNGEMEFRNESQLSLLTARFGNGVAGESLDQQLVIREKIERTTFEEIAVMEKGGINSLEFTVKGGVTLLRRSEFGRKEGEWLANSLYLLVKDGT